eukprot:scaffold5219_cov148-Skeletonema_dohrnii-CCMP3373.AAC.11
MGRSAGTGAAASGSETLNSNIRLHCLLSEEELATNSDVTSHVSSGAVFSFHPSMNRVSHHHSMSLIHSQVIR